MAFRRSTQLPAALVLFCIAALTPSALAQTANQLEAVVNDFATIDGYVVALKNRQYIVDLDASKGIQPGDLLAVVGKGEAIVHPITGKTVGNLDAVKAVLKITRTHSGFSSARLLRESSPIAIGDPVRRYAGLKADFWDLTGKGEPLWRLLQRRIPDMIWNEYKTVDRQGELKLKELASASTAQLHFILTPDLLKVVDSQTNPLHEYAVTIDRDDSLALPSVSYQLYGTGYPEHAPASRTASPASPPAREPPSDRSIDFSTAVSVGEINGGVIMADFVGKAGEVFMAATDGSVITVYAVSEEIRAVATADIGVQKQILFLKWWSPPKGRSIYLAASVWSDHRPSAIVFALAENRLESVFERPNCVLGAFDLDGDHLAETLLSQQFDPESFFGYRFHQLVFNGTTVAVVRSDLDLPLDFTVSGSQFADLTNNGKNESIVVRNGVLNIYADHEPLYASSKQMGGTLSVLTYRQDPSFKDFILTTTSFEIPPLAVDLDDDAQQELLAIASDRSSITAPGAYLNIKNIHFVSFNYADGRFTKKVLSQPFDTPVQGLAVVGKHIYYVVTELKSGASLSGRGRLFRCRLGGQSARHSGG